MSNALFGFPIYSDLPAVTLVNGSWNASLPLNNLKDARLALKTRSTNALVASTTFDTDLTTARAISLIALPKHNLSINATIRILGSALVNFASTVYDSGNLDVFPQIYPAGTLPALHPSFATGKLTAEDAVGYDIGFVHVLTAATSARYWRITITDTGNAAGYVELSRLIIASAWQPSGAIQAGHQLNWITSTTSRELDGGAMVFRTLASRRRQAFTLNLPVDEALVWFYEMQRQLSVNRQFYFVFDAADTVHMARRSFLATLRTLNAIEYPYFGRNTSAFEVLEVK